MNTMSHVMSISLPHFSLFISSSIQCSLLLSCKGKRNEKKKKQQAQTETETKNMKHT